MHYLDFHVHLDFYDDSEELIQKYENNRIYALFATNLPEIYAKHILKYSKLKYVKLALGYHPDMVNFYDFNQDCFDRYFETTNYIGEIGLDYSSKNEVSRKKQYDTFTYICRKVNNKPKILSIHSRRAENDTLNVLKEFNVKYAVFHWYTGSLKLIPEILEQGYFFSVNYAMLNAQKGKSILSHIPLDRILFETDGPFYKIDKKIISPDNFPKIYNDFNTYYGIDNFQDIVFNNFRKLLMDRQHSDDNLILLSK